jgi:hypothetical protein
MASLEAEINQYTIEIKEKEAEIKGLRRRLEDANDDKKERRLEQEIQALEAYRAELLKLRRELQDKLPGAFLDSSGSTLTATTPVASCISPGSLLSLHGALQLLQSQDGEP